MMLRRPYGPRAGDLTRGFGLRSRHPAVVACCLAFGSAVAAEPFPVSIRVDAGAPGGELEPIWRFFGADEPNYAYMENGRKLPSEDRPRSCAKASAVNRMSRRSRASTATGCRSWSGTTTTMTCRGTTPGSKLLVRGLPSGTTGARVELFRVDGEHSNSFTAWQRMGRPEKPTAEQYAELERAGRLASAGKPETVAAKVEELRVRFDLPRQGVALVVLELEEGADQRGEGRGSH